MNLKSTWNRIHKRVISGLLTAVMTLSMVPATMLTASASEATTDGMPDQIKVTGANFQGSYTSVNGLGNCGIHDFYASVNGQNTLVFCLDHGAAFGAHSIGKSWTFTKKIPARTDLLTIFADYYYTCLDISVQLDEQYPDGTTGPGGETYNSAYKKNISEFYWTPAERIANNAWIQAATWLFTSHYDQYADVKENTQTQMKIAQERTVSLNKYLGSSSVTDAQSFVVVQDVIQGWFNGKYKFYNYYKYVPDGSAGAHAQDQPLLVPFRAETLGNPGWIKVLKTDTAGNPLSGAKFTAYLDSACSQTIDSQTTDATGWAYIQIGEERFGGQSTMSVYVKETGAPSGFTLDSSVYQTAVSNVNNKTKDTAAPVNGGTSIKDSSTPPPPGSSSASAIIQKVDASTNGGVGPATFHIFGTASDNTKVDTYKQTDAGGAISLQWKDQNQPNYIKPGTYTVQETIPPAGYELDTVAQSMTLVYTVNGGTVQYYATTSDGTGSLIFKDYPLKSIVVYKQSETNQPLAGAAFDIYKDGTKVGSGTTGSDGTFTYAGKDGKGLERGYYYFEETNPPAGYLLPNQVGQGVFVDPQLMTQVSPIRLTFTNYKDPEITIFKRSAGNNEPLAGATFEVRVNGSDIGSYTTDGSGKIVIPPTTFASYLVGTGPWEVAVREVTEPDGYMLDDAGWKLKTLTKGQDLAAFEFTDTPYPEIVIIKRDAETGDVLADATFHVTVGTHDVGDYTTNANGEIHITHAQMGQILNSTNWDGWKVNVTETKVPQYYNLDNQESGNTTISKTLSRGQNSLSFEFKDTHYRDIEVVKKDAQTSWPLSGATFTLQSVSGNPGFTTRNLTTDASGKVLFENVPNGHYKLTETTAPYGYETTSQSYDFTVTSASERVLQFEFKNEPKSGIRIQKLDAATKQPIKGAEFEIKPLAPLTGAAFTRVTDSNGLIVLDEPGLTAGSYQITEKSVPAPYVCDSTPRVVEVDDMHNAYDAIFYNYAEGMLYIRKLDSVTQEPLAGAYFTIYSASGTVIDTVGPTGPNGYVTYAGLKPGSYNVKEIKAPAGHSVDPSVQSFTVKPTDSGEIYVLYFDNQPHSNLWIKKIDALTGVGLEGAQFKITKANGEVVKSNATTDAAGYIQITGLQEGTYIAVEIKAPTGYTLDMSEHKITVRADDTEVIEISNNKPGGIRIQKIDAETGNPLKGAEFQLFDVSDKLIGTGTTDDQGYVTWSGLVAGSYFARETKAPEGFEVSTEAVKINVENFKTTEYIWKNSKMSSITVLKRDAETLVPLGGATFEVRDLDGKLYDSITTDLNGSATTKQILAGAYWVEEVKAPTSYEISGDKQMVQVSGSKVSKVTFDDYAYKSIIIRKYSSVTKEPLAGATFEVRDSSGKVIGTQYMTDASGVITTPAMKPGEYYVVEVKAPDMFVLDSTPIKVDLTAQKAAVVDVYNTPKTIIKIYKTDSVTGDPINGVEFTITTADGKNKQVVTTDKTGWAYSTELEPGNYTVVEHKAAVGYTLDTTPRNVTLKAGQSETVTVKNVPDTALHITKIGATSRNPVAGAVFEVYRDRLLEPVNLVGQYETNEYGIATTEPLTPGGYYIREISAPAGFIKTDKTYSIVIKAGEYNNILVENQEAASLIARKLDAKTGKPLQGAVFKLETADHSLIGTMETDKNGEALFTNLTAGHYIVTEQVAPNNYNKQPCSKTILVEYGKQNYVDFVDEENGSLIIILQDKHTGEYLPDGQFQIIRESNQVVVYDNHTDITGTLVIGELTPGWYTIVHTYAPDGYTIVTREIKVEIISGQQQTIYFKDETASLVIEKVNRLNTKEMLEGARFAVTRLSDGINVGEFVTDNDGLAMLKGLTPGRYEVREVVAPHEFELDQQPQVVEVKGGTTAHVTFTDLPYTSITVNVVDEHNKPIPGADIEIYYQNGNLYNSYTTDTTGVVETLKLPSGYYTVKLVTIPDGYTASVTEGTVQLKNGQEGTYTFKLQTNGSLTINSKDESGNVIPNAEVTVTTVTGTVVGTYTTDASGMVVVKNLLPGAYVVSLSGVPSGYTIITSTVNVSVVAGGSATVTVKAQSNMNLTVNVIDKVTRTGVAGCTVEIRKENASGTLIKTVNTDSTGTFTLEKLESGSYYLKLTKVIAGYTAVTVEGVVNITAGNPGDFTFELVPDGSLTVISTDNAGKPIPGMKFDVTTMEGKYIGSYVTSGDTGSYTIPSLNPGWYIVTEKECPSGYTFNKDLTSQNVEIKAGESASVTYAHTKTMGLQIRTTVQQTRATVAGAVYEVRTQSGALIGTYTTGANGTVMAALEPGWYQITQVSIPKGYVSQEKGPRLIEVKGDVLTTVDFVISQLSGLRIHIVDGTTGRGIYGVRLLLKNGTTCVKEYTTNNEGYINLDVALLAGGYTLEMISVPSGYVIDPIPKSVDVLNGQTSEILWTLYKNAGQIQAVVTSLDYNKTRDLPAGSLLQGAVFQIMNADTYQVVGYMISDAYGVAASAGLPIGRYIVSQITAPAYYAISEQKTEVRLKINNDVVRTEFQNRSVNLGSVITQKTNSSINAGQSFRVDILRADNTSDVRLDNFNVHIKVPTDAARISTLSTGTWNAAVWYKISYKTNMNDYRLLAGNLNSQSKYTYDLSAQSLGLQSSEYVTDIRMEFGTVPAGFAVTNKTAYSLYVLSTVYNGFKLLNRLELSGQYNTTVVSTNDVTAATGGMPTIAGNSGQWTTNTSVWTTTVKNSKVKMPSTLPKTGY